MTIIPAEPGWKLVEQMMDEDLKHQRFAYSHIIAWSIRRDGQEVVPIMPYGEPEDDKFFMKAPDDFYWREGQSYNYEQATTIAHEWAAEARARFDRTRNRTVSKAQAVDIAGEPGGI
jgi:hypothetical protein